ncbi:MAG: YdcF family protein [Verrucomicrobiales bacterium]
MIFVFRAPILTGLARLWIVNDSLEKADAGVVLGGGLQSRPFKAAELHKKGLAPLILVMNPEPSPTTEINLTPSEAELTRLVLYKEGVQATNIIVAPMRVSSTFDETLAVKEWAASNQVQSLIIPTGLFHTRRARWIFERTLKGENIKLLFVAIPERKYSETNWWKHEEGIIDFQNEALKSIYYLLKY